MNGGTCEIATHLMDPNSQFEKYCHSSLHPVPARYGSVFDGIVSFFGSPFLTPKLVACIFSNDNVLAHHTVFTARIGGVLSTYLVLLF